MSEANEVVRRTKSFAWNALFARKKKEPSKPPFDAESPLIFAVQSSRLTRLAPVDSAVETHERDKTRSVASVFADGDERVQPARAWGGASGAEEAAARRRAFARGVARHARAEGRPDRPPRRLGVPPAPDPPSRENSLSSIVRYFSCAFFGRETRVGERRCPGHHAHAARRAAVRASGEALTLQKGLDMWFMALSVYTTEYSSRPPAASNGRGDLWYGLDGSCGHCAANARSATRWGLNEPRAATARAAARRRANIERANAWDVLLSARV